MSCKPDALWASCWIWCLALLFSPCFHYFCTVRGDFILFIFDDCCWIISFFFLIQMLMYFFLFGLNLINLDTWQPSLSNLSGFFKFIIIIIIIRLSLLYLFDDICFSSAVILTLPLFSATSAPPNPVLRFAITYISFLFKICHLTCMQHFWLVTVFSAPGISCYVICASCCMIWIILHLCGCKIIYLLIILFYLFILIFCQLFWFCIHDETRSQVKQFFLQIIWRTLIHDRYIKNPV